MQMDHLHSSPAASIFANITNQIDAHYSLLLPTEYFALVASSSPSLSQLIIGFGFPWAEQLSRVLPPSFASTYCGGVAVNDGGAAKRGKKPRKKEQWYDEHCSTRGDAI